MGTMEPTTTDNLDATEEVVEEVTPEEVTVEETPVEEPVVEEVVEEEVAEPETTEVKITYAGFEPNELTVKKGTTLVFNAVQGKHLIIVGGKTLNKGKAIEQIEEKRKNEDRNK